jgi:Patatin-like phospholipase
MTPSATLRITLRSSCFVLLFGWEPVKILFSHHRHRQYVRSTLSVNLRMAQHQRETGLPPESAPNLVPSKPFGHIPRILALDGGGVRGLSSLLVVRSLMHEVQRLLVDNGQAKTGDKLPVPCQYFDLICGTSTGGLIAIMLGRLRMV